MRPFVTEGRVRVLIETLRLSKITEPVELENIASNSKTTETFAKKVLTHALGETDDVWICVSPKLRVILALEVARAGRLRDAAQVLTWQEFEKFGEECLEEAGFRTERNVRVKGQGRAWQIDLVGVRGELVIAIDCKHWNTPSYISRFKLAAEHQRHATLHLLATVTERRQGLAVILTLREPPAQFSEDVVLVSVERFPSFLSGVTPYAENLPFMTSPLAVVESPMSQSS
jgi:hypothetical protein